jgi:hypothetical protein
VTRAQQAPGLGGGEWVALTPLAGADDEPSMVRVEFRPDH